MRAIEAISAEGDLVGLAAAPLTHAAGRLALNHLYRGGTVVVISVPDPGVLLKVVPEHGVTEFFLPPTAIYALLAHPEIRKTDLSSLKSIGYGSAPMSLTKLKEAIEVIGPVMQGGIWADGSTVIDQHVDS